MTASGRIGVFLESVGNVAQVAAVAHVKAFKKQSATSERLNNMIKANKTKHNSTGKLLNISRYTGGGLTPLVTADNRMIRRMRGERGKK